MEDYIIIAGTSKAGTTSLFDYLGDHPMIKPSFIKQTSFFLDKEWQVSLNMKSLYDYDKGLDQFDGYFVDMENISDCRYKLEASPDYLYSVGTPRRIKQFLTNRKGKVIILLRNPVDRFTSFFFFGKQQGLIPPDMDYKSFFSASKHYTLNTNPCLMAYRTGFYSSYLKNYMREIPSNSLYILFFEDLVENPKGFMQSLCNDLEIDASFYNDYTFAVKNQTITIKVRWMNDLYAGLREIYIKHFFKNKLGRSFAGFLKNVVTPIYRQVNYKSINTKEVDKEVMAILSADYAADKERIERITKLKVPWRAYKK